MINIHGICNGADVVMSIIRIINVQVSCRGEGRIWVTTIMTIIIGWVDEIISRVCCQRGTHTDIPTNSCAGV